MQENHSTPQLPLQLAQDWFDAWNRHDLDGIMAHYAEEIEFRSPFIVQLLGDPEGCIRDKSTLRDYFARALTLYSDLHFDPIQVLPGVNSLVLYYRSVRGLFAAEYLEINDRGLITRVAAHYQSETVS